MIVVNDCKYGYGVLFFFDFDNFKMFNDIKGYEIGDWMFIEVVNWFKDCVWEMDIVVCVGGDEFVIVL